MEEGNAAQKFSIYLLLKVFFRKTQFKLIRNGFFLHLYKDAGVVKEAILGIKILLDPAALPSNLYLHKYLKPRCVRLISSPEAHQQSEIKAIW